MKEIYKATRNWGDEYLVFFAPKYYTLKILKINSGHKGGLQSHHLKFETGIILSGSIKIRKGKNLKYLKDKILTKGDFFVFEPGIIHQEEAIVDTYILEISSPHFNDRIRYDHRDNDDNFLSSTSKDQVLELKGNDDLKKIIEFGFEKTPLNEANFLERILKNSLL
tara:strand:+ start:178 stop:675 length:498 start_codon:yes stop_codon:yes gene_type:complete